MEKTIWKFQLKTEGVQQVEMPEGSNILCMQLQFDEPCIWAIVDPKAKIIKRTFETFGTGHPIPEANREYTGTYQLHGGQLIFHVFELLSLKK